MAALSQESPELQQLDESPECSSFRKRASRKRPALPTTPTPKRPRVETLCTPTGKRQRTLFVTSPRESPSTVVARKIVLRALARTPKKAPSGKWTDLEKAAFVEFLALRHDTSDQIWPACGLSNPLWEDAATYVSTKLRTTKRKAAAMRSMCTKEFRRYATVEDAETAYGVDYYGSPKVTAKKSTPRRPVTPAEKEAQTPIATLLALELPDLLQSLDSLFIQLCRKNGLKVHDRQFVTNSFRAMELLQQKKKPNVLASLAEVIAGRRIPMDRMPWGLLQYQIEFFKCSHMNQIKDSIPEDLIQWVESVCSQGQGSTVLLRLLRGPMWSGFDAKDMGKISLKKALEALPKDGRYWIKLDGTDVKSGVFESVNGVWSGDVDLGDGKLQELRELYDQRISKVKSVEDGEGVQRLLDEFKEDLDLLEKGLVSAGEVYTAKKQQKGVSLEALKVHGWHYVEYQELMRLAHMYSSNLMDLIDENLATINAYLHQNRIDIRMYLKNLYKKKRTPATHILVVMVADEHRVRKPYSVPVQYIPYATLRDQFLRDLLVNVKETMTQLGLKVEGVVTDGEFHTLRTRGNTRSLHLWQIVHDARDAVRKVPLKVLTRFLTPADRADPITGLVTAQTPNEAVPQAVLQRVQLLMDEGNSFQEVVNLIRGGLVPEGYVPHPFRENTPENPLDKLRSIMATFYFRKTVADFLRVGVDFTTHLYIPEVDATTGELIHERSDHNHLVKRIAASTREGKYQHLNLQAFDAAVRDRTSGLTHAALAGLRKQSVPDAERLLSYRMARYMETHGHVQEASYIQHIARWHEASDGRGLTQLERCKANYELLNYILDEWMPWHREQYDFSTIDVNKPTTSIRGLTYQTLIEVTCNIESQEQRRTLTVQRGYHEHPRAGTTDDNECFFSLSRRHLGKTFTIKEFAAAFPRIVREFMRKLDDDLPFYYYILNERYHLDEPDFDDPTGVNEEHPYAEHYTERLHKEIRNTREDSSILGGARAALPARNAKGLRQELFAVPAVLPPVPPNLLP